MTTQTQSVCADPEGVGEQHQATEHAEPDEHGEHALHGGGGGRARRGGAHVRGEEEVGPGAVGRGDGRREDEGDEHDDARAGLDRALPRDGDDVLLGQAADDQRHAGQRQQPEEERDPQQRRREGAAAQGPGRRAPDGQAGPADGEEEQRLEDGVRPQVEQPGIRPGLGWCGGERRQHDAHLADRRPREQPLEVALREGQHRGEQHRQRHRDAEHPARRLAHRQQREEAGQHDGARGDHRRRVDQGAGGGGALHGVGEPVLEGQLRRLAEHADDDEREEHGPQRAVGRVAAP